RLCQFLLDLLSSPENSQIISWTNGQPGEFKLLGPEAVARKWGDQTGKQKMTYKIMSRALRHSYAKGIISKVPSSKWA
ncbi:predicted protein, partial [Nematostella vectensis]